MSTINDGGPAFPSHGSMGEVVNDGMTLRDYFAAKLMTVFLEQIYANGGCTDGVFVPAARTAYEMADAMLAAREVTP